MANQFPLGNKELCIGILGMTEGNAHPFSWSAMYNGYDKDVMYEWTHELYPSIPDYLGKQPPETFGIPGAHITHVCFTGYEDRAMAENCARASRIPNVCTDPLEMLGSHMGIKRVLVFPNLDEAIHVRIVHLAVERIVDIALLRLRGDDELFGEFDELLDLVFHDLLACDNLEHNRFPLVDDGVTASLCRFNACIRSGTSFARCPPS